MQQFPFLADQQDLDYDPIGSDGATTSYRVRKTLFSKKTLAFLMVSMLAIAAVVYVSNQRSSVTQNHALTEEVQEITNAEPEKWVNEPASDFNDVTEDEDEEYAHINVPKMKAILRNDAQKSKKSLTKIQFALKRKECPVCNKFDKWSAACRKCHYHTTKNDLRILRRLERHQCNGKPGARNFDPVYCKKIKQDIRDHLRKLADHKKYCGKAKKFRHPCHACLIKTLKPTKRPTNHPTKKPTAKPTTSPSPRPTKSPSSKPTKSPTHRPTKAPTSHPTHAPTSKPTRAPTSKPTTSPSRSPTSKPTRAPTSKPTKSPTHRPTKAPTHRPTASPTNRPTQSPTSKPTTSPTPKPTTVPTKSPTSKPTTSPTPAHAACGKFTIIKQPMTWNRANHECKFVFGGTEKDASLASIHDDKDNDLLKKCFKEHGLTKEVAAWIGFTDKKTQGKWRWHDKTLMTYLNWAKNEPNNHAKKERCAEIYTKGKTAGFWNDESCSSHRYAVCQKKAPVLKEKFHRNGRFILIPHRANWLNGAKICRKFYGKTANLISIHGKKEQLAIAHLMKSNSIKRAYIGFTDKYSGGRMRHWVWSDGTPANYHNWAAGEPNNFATERCAEVWFTKMKNGLPTWNNLPCTYKHTHVLCEKKKPTVRLPQIGRFFLLKRKVNFVKGILGCRKLLGPYANLASIHSVTENDMITNLMKKHAPTHDALIGLEDTHRWYSWSFRWAWSDGTRFNYKKWAKGEPNNWKKERCGEVWIRSKNKKFKYGMWNNMGCNPLRSKLYAVCEKKAPHKWRVKGKALKEDAEYLKLAGPGVDDELEQKKFLEHKDDPTFEAMGPLPEITGITPEIEEPQTFQEIEEPQTSDETEVEELQENDDDDDDDF